MFYYWLTANIYLLKVIVIVLLSLLLIFNICHTLSSVFIVDFELVFCLLGTGQECATQDKF